MYTQPTVTGFSNGSPVRPSYKIVLPLSEKPEALSVSNTSLPFAPSNTGVAM